MPSAKRTLQQAVKLAAAGTDLLVHPPAGLVILIYHRVGAGSGLEVDLPAELFEAQVAALAATGRVVSLAEGLRSLAGAAAGAPGTSDAGADRAAGDIVITFDDGTADFVDVALPILERHQMPVTLYAATDFVDRGVPFPNDGRPVSWAGLAEAVSTGLVNVGSHTHRHLLLDRLDPTQVADELDRSIELIGQHLGAAPSDFAYPKAVPGSPAAEQAVRSRFRSAALAGTHANPVGAADPHRLARSPIQRSDGLRWFHRKADGGLRLEDTLRRGLNRRRYATATA